MSEILFICEHGSAKSMVAAAHFNRIAVERGRTMRAVSRGTDPDALVHPAALDGQAMEGLTPPGEPKRLSATDLGSAQRIIAFSDLLADYNLHTEATIWTVPPVSENYGVARDAILERVSALFAELAQY